MSDANELPRVQKEVMMNAIKDEEYYDKLRNRRREIVRTSEGTTHRGGKQRVDR